MFAKFLTTAVATVAVFSTLISGYALPTSPLDTRAAAAPKFNFTPKHLIGLEHALQVINSIPDDVLASGDAAAAAWINDNTDTIQSETKDLVLAPGSGAPTTDLIVVQDLWAVTLCAAAIAEFLISNLIPAAKLLKLKGIIAKLGGITNAVKLLIASRGNLAAAAELIKQLVEILSGFGTVASRCF